MGFSSKAPLKTPVTSIELQELTMSFENDSAANEFANKWRKRVKAIYEASDGYNNAKKSLPCEGRLIPLCTPILQCTKVLVIGRSHSVFDSRSGKEGTANFDPRSERFDHRSERFGPRSERMATANLIANDYADTEKDVTINTFMRHNHEFARYLDFITSQQGNREDENYNNDYYKGWVGTNRCPIQTGPNEDITNAYNELQNKSWFKILQRRMDIHLKCLIKMIRPRYVLLCGKEAVTALFGAGTIIENTPEHITTTNFEGIKFIGLWLRNKTKSRQRFNARAARLL